MIISSPSTPRLKGMDSTPVVLVTSCMLTSTLYRATSSLSLGMQCAAVITMRGAMREPPQNGALEVFSLSLLTKPTMNPTGPSISSPLTICCGGACPPSLSMSLFEMETPAGMRAPFLLLLAFVAFMTSFSADAEMLPPRTRRKTEKSIMVVGNGCRRTKAPSRSLVKVEIV